MEPRSFGPEDLHLLSGLADFLAVVLDRAQEWREVERLRQLLGLLLNQAPVGHPCLRRAAPGGRRQRPGAAVAGRGR